MSEPWTDEEWGEMTAWERLTRLPEEFDRRSGRLDAEEIASAGEGSTVETTGNDYLGTAPATDATGATVDELAETRTDVGEYTLTDWHANNREEATEYGLDVGRSLLDRLWEIVPTWAWGLGAIVLAGAAYTYTRPLWSIAGGVVA